jgi:protocatechuate 3,4-dioxygenase beta subunit
MAADQHATRRRFLVAGAWVSGAALAATGRNGAFAQQTLPPTPACDDGGAPTAAQTEGPFFKPSSPERSELLEAGMAGQPVELSGFVLTRNCRPVERALVDLWQADSEGEYDTRQFRLRGHQFTDAQGRYGFRTLLPGAYPGRTRHFHVKVQRSGGRILTTQLYFPGEAKNRGDGLFRRELLMRVAKAGDGLAARFDFVLDAG